MGVIFNSACPNSIYTLTDADGLEYVSKDEQGNIRLMNYEWFYTGNGDQYTNKVIRYTNNMFGEPEKFDLSKFFPLRKGTWTGDFSGNCELKLSNLQVWGQTETENTEWWEELNTLWSEIREKYNLEENDVDGLNEKLQSDEYKARAEAINTKYPYHWYQDLIHTPAVVRIKNGVVVYQ